jgi:hypothetical protein
VSVAAVRVEARAAAAVAGARAAEAHARRAPHAVKLPRPALASPTLFGWRGRHFLFAGVPIGRSRQRAARPAGCVASVLASSDARAAELVAAMPQEVRTHAR